MGTQVVFSVMTEFFEDLRSSNNPIVCQNSNRLSKKSISRHPERSRRMGKPIENSREGHVSTFWIALESSDLCDRLCNSFVVRFTADSVDWEAVGVHFVNRRRLQKWLWPSPTYRR